MSATKRVRRWTSRRIVVLLMSVTALAVTFTPLASAQAIDVGGSVDGTGIYQAAPYTVTVTVDVKGTPEAATGPVALIATRVVGPTETFAGVARCIAIKRTATGFRASIAGGITAGTHFNRGDRGFEFTIYDNTLSLQTDQISGIRFDREARTACNFEFGRNFQLTRGDFTVVPLGFCPPGDDEDNDGLTDHNENIFTTLLGNADSDLDGITDGNDDANGNGEDDEDEDDDEDDGCPDEDSDGDGEDDEDEDDDEDDD